MDVIMYPYPCVLSVTDFQEVSWNQIWRMILSNNAASEGSGFIRL